MVKSTLRSQQTTLSLLLSTKLRPAYSSQISTIPHVLEHPKYAVTFKYTAVLKCAPPYWSPLYLSRWKRTRAFDSNLRFTSFCPCCRANSRSACRCTRKPSPFGRRLEAPLWLLATTIWRMSTSNRCCDNPQSRPVVL